MSKFNRDTIRDNIINWLPIAGVVFLAAASFVLSYDALRQLALNNQVKPSLVWLFPLSIDVFIISAMAVTLRMAIRQHNHNYAWWLAIGFTVISVAGNILHIDSTQEWYIYIKPWLPRIIAAVPPLALALGVHLLIVILRDDIKSVVKLSPTKQAVSPHQPITPPTKRRQKMSPQQKRATAIKMFEGGHDKSAIMAELDVSDRTVERYLEKMSQNGAGRE